MLYVNYTSIKKLNKTKRKDIKLHEMNGKKMSVKERQQKISLWIAFQPHPSKNYIGLPQNIFRFSCNILWENPNEIFGQLNTTERRIDKILPNLNGGRLWETVGSPGESIKE